MILDLDKRNERVTTELICDVCKMPLAECKEFKYTIDPNDKETFNIAIICGKCRYHLS